MGKSQFFFASLFLILGLGVAAESSQFTGEVTFRFVSDQNFPCLGVLEALENQSNEAVHPDKSSSRNQKVTQCLNDYGKYLLREGGRLAQSFYAPDGSGVFNSYASRYGLDPSEHEPLSEFSIRAPLISSNLDLADGKICFDYDALPLSQQKALVLFLKKQMEQVGEFLVYHHSQSGGSRGSLFFNIKEVEICSSRSLKGVTAKGLTFSKHILHLGVDSSEPPLSMAKIAKGWAHPNVIRRVNHSMGASFYQKLPWGKNLRKFIVYQKAGEMGVLTDQIAKYWRTLFNPTSEGRSGPLMDLRQLVHKAMAETSSSDPVAKLTEGAARKDGSGYEKMIVDARDGAAIQEALMAVAESGPGLDRELEFLQSLSPEDDKHRQILKKVYRRYHRNLRRPGTYVTVLETAIGEAARSKTDPLYNPHGQVNFSRKVFDREGWTGIGATVLNDKDIGVMVQMFMQGGGPSVSQFSQESYDKQRQKDKGSQTIVVAEQAVLDEIADQGIRSPKDIRCIPLLTSKAVCALKAFADSDAMYFKDDQIEIIAKQPNTNYDLYTNQDRSVALIGSALALNDDVQVGAGLLLSMPRIGPGTVRRYCLGKAFQGVSLPRGE